MNHDDSADCSRELGAVMGNTTAMADGLLVERWDGGFRLAVEAAPVAMLVAHQAGSILLANAQLERLFAYQRDALVGEPLDVLVPERFRAGHASLRAKFAAQPSMRAMGAGRDLYGVRRDGVEVPIEIGLNPVVTREGVLVLATVVDLTERRAATRRMDDLLREKDALLKEVHHRVKNNLQVVSSLLSLHASRLCDEPARSVFAQCRTRVRAIALVHEKLGRSPDLSRVRFSDYARDLTKDVLQAQAAEPRSVVCAVQASDVCLSADRCILCGLVVNELVTNAVRHAFVGRDTGRVDVSLVRSDAVLELRVSDDGIGLPASVELAQSTTLGLDLVATFARRLNAELSITRQPGTSVVLRFHER